jgi:hypothetical protein
MKFENPRTVTANQICWRNETEFYIRQIHVLNKGQDDEWLKDYIKEVLHKWQNDLKSARDCFEMLYMEAKGKTKWQRSTK